VGEDSKQALLGLPPRLGRYEVTGLLGRGGMGRVVRGHDPVLKRDVALKLVEPSAIDASELPELRFLFHREARATAALRHPNIVEVYDYSGPDADVMFLACELIDAPTLRDVLNERERLPIGVAAACGYELAQALALAHEQGIVHRDLKPENIFWTAAGRIVVSDFGIAKAFDGGARLGATLEFGATSVYGSPAYMAPEQLANGALGPHTDLHALGAVLFEICAGAQAFDGADMRCVLEAVSSGRRAPLPDEVTLPAALALLLDELLDPDAARRPRDADEVAESLRRVLDGLGVSDPRRALRDFGQELIAEESAASAPRDASAVTEVVQTAATTGRPLPAAFWLAPLLVGTLAGGLATRAWLNQGPALGAARGRPRESRPRLVNGVHARLEFDGPQAELFIDGILRGSIAAGAHVLMPLGAHHVEVRSRDAKRELDVLVLEGTSPTFDLTAPASP